MRSKRACESKNMIAKIHSADGRKIVAICDSGILGKKFEEGESQLDLTGDFYKGKEMSEEEITEIVKHAFVINLAGEESVALGIRLGIISEENVSIVGGIKHAQSMVTD